VLEKPAAPVTVFDEALKKLVDDMFESMYEAHGVGLAAPQIGIGKRVAVVDVTFKEDPNAKLVLINPEIILTEGRQTSQEGCLSIPGWYGPVKRKERVTVRGLSRTGKPIKVKAEGWEARAFQHEVDHLDGILFTDRMEDPSLLHRVESKEEEEELDDEQVFA